MTRACWSAKDKVAVITGAGGGIGRALALALARGGATLALSDRDEASVGETTRLARATGAQVSVEVFDIANPSSITRYADAVTAGHGRTDLLVNNAGVNLYGRFAETSEAEFAWLMDINFWAAARMTWAFLPLLQQAPEARIAFVSSVFGLISPAGTTAYAASKFALRGFGEALRHELEGTNVGVTVIHPGGVKTGIARTQRVAAGANAEGARQAANWFERSAASTPEQAAATILDGLERRKPRVLIGKDARMLDRIQRFRPATYWGTVKRLSGLN